MQKRENQMNKLLSREHKKHVVTSPGQAIPPVKRNVAVTLLVPFSKIKHLISGNSQTARPNRNHPINVVDPQLREEIAAWDAASDQALEKLERDFVE
jgi:hypothetical protein